MYRLRELQAAILCTILDWKRVYVAAQSHIVFPQCKGTAFSWAFNKEGQSPCQVASILQSTCFHNTWIMDPIMPGKEYGGPLRGQSNICQCNTVVFSLAAACGACQDGSIADWTFWRINCSESNVKIASYPVAVPLSTSVPAWAYLNVTATGNIWDETAALALAQTNPFEATGGSPPPVGPSTPPPPSTSTGSPNPSSTHSGSSSKAGPIAGGVVGGLAGIIALALVGFGLYRRSYRPKQGVQRMNEKLDIVGPASPAPGQGHMRSLSDDDPPKLYDPSDPSTFPPAPFPDFAGSSSPRQHPYGNLGKQASGSGASGYSGVPEV